MWWVLAAPKDSQPPETWFSADALMIVTEWLVYRNPDLGRIKETLRHPVVIDGRNLFDPERMNRLGFIYYGVGRRRT